MTIKPDEVSATKTTLTVSLSEAEMAPDHQQVTQQLSSELKLAGFRPGHIPLAVASKQLDPQAVANAFLEKIIPRISEQVLNEQDLPAVLRPDIALTKFVPFSQLELTISYQHTSKIDLADYLKLPLKINKPAAITAQEVSVMIERLRTDLAIAKEVKRPAKTGDRLQLDFSASTGAGQALAPLSAKDHRLVLGSKSMPPGFEAKLIEARANQELKFKLKLPDMPSLPILSQLKVEFVCQIKKVEELKLPPVDDKLAAKVGEYKTIDELKGAIKDQLKSNQQRQQQLNLDEQILELLRRQSQITLPRDLLKEQLKQNLDAQEAELKRLNLTYQEWLKARSLSSADHRQQLQKSLKRNLKVSFLLTEIAKLEKIKISDQDFDKALKSLVSQPEPANDQLKGRLRGRLLAEATILFLRHKLTAQPE